MTFNAHIESNIDALIAEMEPQVPADEAYVGEIINPTEYAADLHNRMGYWVMNDDVLSRHFDDEMQRGIERATAAGRIFGNTERSRAAFNALRKTVEHYQSVIGTKDTPGRVKLPPRPRHPGDWASDTEQLVRSYVTYLRSSGRTIDFSTYRDVDL